MSGGRRIGFVTAAGSFGSEPVVSTPTLTAAADTWINQKQLIDEQRNDLFRPLVLEAENRRFHTWRKSGHGMVHCP